jgi:HD-GYP domain-containing protein (c-di-GMP phosphodiesterase class II)
MSWDPPSGAPSSEADPAAGGLSQVELAELAQTRGATLLDALEGHRPGSRDHADATASYAFAAAVELGFERDHAEAVRETARLHDVGMIYVPAPVLAATPETRDQEGNALIAAHPTYGAELALGAGVPAQACGWIRAGAERFDGRGPAGLAGERVPLESRIIRVACACDTALTASPPAGSSAEHRDAAFAALWADAGRALDPRVVEALTGMLDRVSRG